MDLLELGLFVWVVDEFGHRHKVRVKNEAERDRLLAKNRALRAKLANKKSKKQGTVRTVKRVKKKSKDFDSFLGY